MHPTPTARTRLIIAALPVVTIAMLGLAGCTGPTAPATPSPSATHTAASAAKSTPSVTASPASAIPCGDLLPTSALASIGKGLTPTPSFTPAEGTYPAMIVQLGGEACEWTDASGNTLVVAVVKPVGAVLASEQQTVAASSTQTSAFGSGISAYEADSGGTSADDYEIFTPGGYWVSVLSPMFPTPESAASTVSIVLQALPAG
jgi:hypothetical protein